MSLLTRNTTFLLVLFTFLFGFPVDRVIAQSFAGTTGISFVEGGQVSFGGLPFTFTPGKGAVGITGSPVILNVSLTNTGNFSEANSFITGTYSLDGNGPVPLSGEGTRSMYANIGALSSGYHTVTYYFAIRNGGSIVVFPSIPLTFSIISQTSSTPNPTATVNSTGSYSPATILNFSVSPKIISYGDTASLSWSASSDDTRDCHVTADDDNDPPNSNAWLSALYAGISGTRTTKIFTGTRIADINFVTFRLSCTGKGSHAQAIQTVSVPIKKPIVSPVNVTITATPRTVSAGKPVQITWTSSGSTDISCVGTGGDTDDRFWTGSSLRANSTVTKVLNTPAVYTYGVICTDGAGMKSDAITTVTVTKELPRAVLDVSPSLTIPSGTGVTLLWTGINADSCETSWAGEGQDKIGEAYTGALTGPRIENYWINCKNSGGESGRILKTITVDAPIDVVVIPPLPRVEITVDPSMIHLGESVHLRYSTTNAETCTHSWDDGTQTVNDTILTPTDTTTYTIHCRGLGGEVSQSDTIEVTRAVEVENINTTPEVVPVIQTQNDEPEVAEQPQTEPQTFFRRIQQLLFSQPEQEEVLPITTQTVVDTPETNQESEISADNVITSDTVDTPINEVPSTTTTTITNSATSSVAQPTITTQNSNTISVQSRTVAIPEETTHAVTVPSFFGFFSRTQSPRIVAPEQLPPVIIFNTNPDYVPYNESVTLEWKTTNATECRSNGGSWPSMFKAIQGRYYIGNLTESKVFVLSCKNSALETTSSIVITPGPKINTTLNIRTPSQTTNTLNYKDDILPNQVPDNIMVMPKPDTKTTVTITKQQPAVTGYTPPKIDTTSKLPELTFIYSTNSRGEAILTWKTANIISCVASGGWSGTKEISGTKNIGSSMGGKVYTLTCDGIYPISRSVLIKSKGF